MAERALKQDPSIASADDTERVPDASRSETPSAAAGTDDPPLLVRDLGWSQVETADTRPRLRPFEDDWDAPGMDAHDDL